MMSLNDWYLIFDAGAILVFVMVVVVVVVLRLARRIGVQLAEVADALATIGSDTAAISAVGEINLETRGMNDLLADVRLDLQRLAREVAP